jgi:hypothetical protein
MARKSKYESHVKPYLDRIPVWRRQGMTELQIAEKLDISHESFYLYKRKYTEFSDSLKTGKAELIEKLEETLYTRAMGKEYEETKTYIEKDEKGKEKKKIEKTKKMLHSDACLIFALKNLDKSKWRDKQDIEHSGVTGVVFVDDIDDTPEQEDDINDSDPTETETEDC